MGYGVSIQISINLGETFLRISSIRKIALTWILARVFPYLLSFFFQILDLIYCTVLIFYFDLFWMAWHWKPAIVGWYVDHHSADISVGTSVDTSTDTSRSTYRLTLDWYVDRHTLYAYRPALGRYVDRYIGRVLVDTSTEMSTDISVDGCTKYTWSENPWKEVGQEATSACQGYFQNILYLFLPSEEE